VILMKLSQDIPEDAKSLSESFPPILRFHFRLFSQPRDHLAKSITPLPALPKFDDEFLKGLKEAPGLISLTETMPARPLESKREG